MYCAVDDIVNSMPINDLRECSSDDETPDIYNSAIILEKITEASSVIDSHVSVRYKLPITDSKDIVLLKSICMNYVVCLLYQRRRYGDEELNKRMELIKVQLREIGNGTTRLSSSSIDTQVVGGKTITGRRNKVFGKISL